MSDKLPDDPFEWYVTRDEECWTLAVGVTNREDAISYGRGDYDNQSFMICEARKGHFALAMDAFDLEAHIMDNSEEQLGEDQDEIFVWPKRLRHTYEGRRYVYTPEVEAERTAISNELRDAVEKTVRAWAAKHMIEIKRPWMFAETRSEETIPAITEEVQP